MVTPHLLWGWMSFVGYTSGGFIPFAILAHDVMAAAVLQPSRNTNPAYLGICLEILLSHTQSHIFLLISCSSIVRLTISGLPVVARACYVVLVTPT